MNNGVGRVVVTCVRFTNVIHLNMQERRGRSTRTLRECELRLFDHPRERSRLTEGMEMRLEVCVSVVRLGASE